MILPMQRMLVFFLCIRTVAAAFGEPIIPTTAGMSWQYHMTQEAGEGVRFSDPKPDPDGKIRANVTYRINGKKNVAGRELLEFEMHRAGRVTNVDLLTVDQHGITCWARVDEEGELTKLGSAQTIVAAPLKTGLTWEFYGEVGQGKVHQIYRVLGEEDVAVPAGKFRAFHIHGEQSVPGKMIIDRWFVDGTGIVKDITETRSDDDDLLRRISLELTKRPKVEARPNVKTAEPVKKLVATVGKGPIGESATEFLSTEPKIYARWQGQALSDGAKIRVVWIAENVSEVAPPDYTIDEASTTATAPDSHGIFALSRPGSGWTPGVYRVEFYVDGNFVDAVKMKITKAARLDFSSEIP